LTKLDLPAPLGAATTKRFPGKSMRGLGGLFDVLDLLAHLLDQDLHVH